MPQHETTERQRREIEYHRAHFQQKPHSKLRGNAAGTTPATAPGTTAPTEHA